MPPRHPAAQQFPNRPFSVTEAMMNGVGRGRLRARDVVAPFTGVRIPVGHALTLADRCRGFALRMPHDAAFSHTTAALLHGIPVPEALEHDTTLHVVVPATRRAVGARDIRGHEMHLPSTDVVHRLGLPITTVERTWCDLSAVLDRVALLAAGDRILFHEDPLASRGSLTAAVDLYRARRGIRALRSTLPLLSDRAESPRESQLRLLLLDSGFPAPEVNLVIRDTAGRKVARVDLAYPAWKVAIEYEGDHHRTDQKQWRRDIARTRDLQALGWTVIRVTLADLIAPAELLATIRHHLTTPLTRTFSRNTRSS
ncbi:endonuclease domain-containing protein [Herbiconiux sp. P17]|uniref:endonuclease domain-containing protein n=1 Tax=Herbiconiux wuyangfengii TaxID=3342794 RepID=UPI0035B6DD33